MGKQWDGSGISDAWQLNFELFDKPYRPGVFRSGVYDWEFWTGCCVVHFSLL